MNKIEILSWAIRATSLPGIEPIRIVSPTIKVEATEGKTSYVINGIDSEVIPTIPNGAMDGVSELDSVWTVWIDQGHFKVWSRLSQVEESLGRWYYFEAKIPVRLLRFPKSKSYRSFERMVELSFALGIALCPEKREYFTKTARRLLDPEVIWLKP